MVYLKAREQYDNDYDRIVINQCRDIEKDIQGKPMGWVSMDKIKKDYRDAKKGKKPSKKDQKESEEHAKYHAGCLFLYFHKMLLAEKREERIQEWMAADRKRDKLFEDAKPRTQYCHQCNIQMEFLEKELHRYFGDYDDVVFLRYLCPHCKHIRVTFADGKEYVFDRPKCEKCSSTKLELKYDIKKNEDIVHKEICLDCGHVKKDLWKHTESPKETIDPHYEEDRRRFCVPYATSMQWRIDMLELERIFKEIDEQNKDKKDKGSPDEVVVKRGKKKANARL